MESLLMYGKRRVTGHCAHLEVIWFMRLHSNAGRDVTQHDITVSFTNPNTEYTRAEQLPSCQAATMVSTKLTEGKNLHPA